MTAAVEPVFLDTNILVYASVDSSPFYDRARAAITAYEANGKVPGDQWRETGT